MDGFKGLLLEFNKSLCPIQLFIEHAQLQLIGIEQQRFLDSKLFKGDCCSLTLAFNVSAHIIQIIFHLFSLDLQTPQQVLQPFLLPACQQLISLSLLFVQLSNRVGRVITACVRAAFLCAGRAEILFALQAIAIVALLMSLTQRQSVDLIHAFDFMSLQNFGAMMVCTASIAKVESLCFAVKHSLFIFATGAYKFCRIKLPLYSNCKIGLKSQQILIMRAKKEIELKRVIIAVRIDQDGIKTGDIVSCSTPAAQCHPAQQEGKHFIRLALSVNVDVPAKYHQIFQWHSFGFHTLHVLLAEVSYVDYCICPKDLFGHRVIGEAEKRDELDGGLASDQLQLIIDLSPICRAYLDLLSDSHRYNNQMSSITQSSHCLHSQHSPYNNSWAFF